MELSQSQGRYYVLDSGPVASPGHCVICGYSGRDRLYLDPRLDFDEFGSVIFCEDCIKAMSVLFGYIDPAQALALEARVEEAERELIKMRAAVAGFEDFSVALSSLGLLPSSNESGSSDKPDSNDESAVESPEDDVTGEGSDDSAFDVSDLVEGPDDVRDASTDSGSIFTL